MLEMCKGSKKLSDEAVARVDWGDVYVRLTGYAHRKLRGAVNGEAEALASEAIEVLFDPGSTVRWNYEVEASPLHVLGSIVNGLVRNRVRKKARTEEVLSDDVHSTAGCLEKFAPDDQAARIIAADFRTKVLNRVLDLSEGDDVVQGLAMLADEGVIDVADQAEQLKLCKPIIYEARSRFQKHVEIARTELDGES